MSSISPAKMPATPAKMSLSAANRALPILALLPHVFCCVLPAFAAFISLASVFGAGTSHALAQFFHGLDAYHMPMLMLAVVSVALCGVFNFVAYKKDCRQQTALSAAKPCTHTDCAPSKRKHFKLFFLACFLLCLDVAWFAFETQVLHVNHGHNEAHGHETHHHDEHHGHGH